MSLLVVLIVLGLRQFDLAKEPAATVSVLMRKWRDSWVAYGNREGWHAMVVLAFIVLPPVSLALIAVSLLSLLWHGLLVGLVSLLVLLIVLLDRQKPDALRREQDSWLANNGQGGVALASVDLMALEAAADEELTRARKGLLEEQLRELFAPLFWFLLLGPLFGPAAALTYYFLRLSVLAGESPASPTGRQLLHYADWPVARALGLSFALAGDFVATWQHWRRHMLNRDIEALTLLDESAAAAQPVDLRMTVESNPGAVLAAALSEVAALLQRTLVIWIVLLALHTLWP